MGHFPDMPIRETFDQLHERGKSPVSVGALATFGRELLIPRRGVDIFHHDERVSVGEHPEVVHGHNGRVNQLAGHPRFPSKQLHKAVVRAKPGMHQLHSNRSVQSIVPRFPDLTEAARSNLPTEPESPRRIAQLLTIGPVQRRIFLSQPREPWLVIRGGHISTRLGDGDAQVGGVALGVRLQTRRVFWHDGRVVLVHGTGQDQTVDQGEAVIRGGRFHALAVRGCRVRLVVPGPSVGPNHTQFPYVAYFRCPLPRSILRIQTHGACVPEPPDTPRSSSGRSMAVVGSPRSAPIRPGSSGNGGRSVPGLPASGALRPSCPCTGTS